MAGCECCDNFSMIDGGDEFKAFPGLKGEDGTTFYPHVSAEGIISWTNDGGKPNPDPVNIKGTDGKSAYQAAVEAGFSGTESEFNEYLSNIGVLTEEVSQQKSAIEALDALVDRKAGALVDTASGAIASFVPDSTIDNLLGVSVAVEPVQAGSGDPSLDNVRPISGWSAVGILATGVNVWDGEWEIGGIDDNTGEKNTVSTQKRSKNYISVAPGSTYYMNTPGVGNAGAFAYAYDSSFGFIGRIRIGSAVHLENLAFTTPANCRYILFKIGSSSYDTAQTSINYPSADHDYHAYTGNTYTITIGQTVYGGTLDAVNGKMYARPYFPSYNGQTLVGPWISSMDVYTPGATPTVGAQVVDMGGAVTEIQLDPVQIATIANQINNLWSDAGDVAVEYAADIKAYIDRLNQPTEDDMIANSLIASGKYFTANNRLFLSTASIAVGAQIIPGTNCTETSLVEALNALNA